MGYELFRFKAPRLDHAHETLNSASAAGAKTTGNGFVRAEAEAGFVGVDRQKQFGSAVTGEVCNRTGVFYESECAVENGKETGDTGKNS